MKKNFLAIALCFLLAIFPFSACDAGNNGGNNGRDRGDIAFITLSIDRSKAKERWLKALEKYHMTGLLNLIPDLNHASPFEDAYFVSGVPRYLIIDKDGNLVTAFAPSPGNGLEELVKQLVK